MRDWPCLNEVQVRNRGGRNYFVYTNFILKVVTHPDDSFTPKIMVQGWLCKSAPTSNTFWLAFVRIAEKFDEMNDLPSPGINEFIDITLEPGSSKMAFRLDFIPLNDSQFRSGDEESLVTWSCTYAERYLPRQG